MNEDSTDRRGSASWAIASFGAGAVLWAAALMTMAVGLSALFGNHLVMITPEWLFRFNSQTWGMIHIALGAAMVITGLGVMFGWMWARVAAIVLAFASMVLLFIWAPYYPVWSTLLIAIDVVIIWSIATWDTSVDRSPVA